MGLLLVILAGLLWVVTGALIGRAARDDGRAVEVLALSSLVTVIFSAFLLPDYHLLAEGLPAGWQTLVIVMGSAGLTGAIGFILMQAAMRRGHQATVWTITQSALVIPFLGGVLFLGDAWSFHRACGVGLVLLSILVLGAASRSSSTGVAQAKMKAFVLALLAFLCVGSSLLLATLPGRWPRVKDPANLRVLFLSLGSMLAYNMTMGINQRRIQRRLIGPALVLGLNGVLSQSVFFAGLDRLTQAGLGCVGYPLAVGTCILGFGLYTWCLLREPATLLHVLGLLCGTAGVAVVAV